ncbi:MAG: hypothetical protein P8046_03890 [Anaerolineales bacterium]
MDSSIVENKPYPPNFIHRLYDLLDRLPLPTWLTLLLLFPLIGIVQHLVAYNRGFLAPGEFNFDLATAGYWLIGGPVLFLFTLKGSRQAWEDFRPLISLDDQQYARLQYEYFTIPKWTGNVFLIIGAVGGAMNGFADMAVAPPVDYAFAELRISIWAIGGATLFLVIYYVFRQLRIMRKLYAIADKVDIFNQQPMYGFPKYTSTLAIIFFIYNFFAPLILDPTAFASEVSYVTTLGFAPVALLMFYLPLGGMHNRLVREKEALQAEVGDRIKSILREIHRAALDRKDFEHTGAMISVHTVLLKEKEAIDSLNTWPRRPGTFRGLLSALLLPVVLSILRDVITGWIGL